MSLRVFWHQVSPSNWSLGLHLYSRYDALPKFSCVPTASPSTAYSVGAAIALPYKTTYAKTTMPAPIATTPILRRTRRLLLTSKRCVVGDGSDMAPPERPWTTSHVGIAPRLGHVLGERLRLSGGVPYLPHGALLDRSWNSRDVRRWVRAPLKQSHCTLLPLGALTAPRSTRSSVNAGLLARAPDRISFASIASISRSVLSTPAIYRVSGQREVLYQIPLIRTRGPIGAVRWT